MPKKKECGGEYFYDLFVGRFLREDRKSHIH